MNLSASPAIPFVVLVLFRPTTIVLTGRSGLQPCPLQISIHGLFISSGNYSIIIKERSVSSKTIHSQTILPVLSVQSFIVTNLRLDTTAKGLGGFALISGLGSRHFRSMIPLSCVSWRLTAGFSERIGSWRTRNKLQAIGYIAPHLAFVIPFPVRKRGRGVRGPLAF